MEKAKEEEKIEKERQRRREEERQVDELRRQMQMRGQAKKEDDVFKRTAQMEIATGVEAEAQAQHKKRLLALKRLDDETASGSTSRAVSSSISSRYKEDVVCRGHTEIWGSHYDPETHKWGYKCCQLKEKNIQCPLADPEEADSKKKRKKKRREADEAARQARSSSEHGAQEQQPGGLRVPNPSSNATDSRKAAEARPNTSSQNSCENTSRLLALKKMQEEKTKKLAPSTEDKAEGDKKKAYVDDLFNDPCA